MFDIYVLFSEKNEVGTRSTGGAVLVAGAMLQSAAAAQQRNGVAAAATAARHTRPEPGQCRFACGSSINVLKIGLPMYSSNIDST